jgi:pantothenate kinase type III
MVSPLLTLDIGNSRAKAALWVAGEDTPVAAVSLPVGADLPDALAARLTGWAKESGPSVAAALCSVGAEALVREVEGVLAEHVAGAVLSPPDHGLEIACRTPETVGLDRLFAARGARERVAGPAIVVDAGTAVTVDVVDEKGVFLGGAIAPGPDLLAHGLERGTARLPRIEPSPGARGLGRDTAEALEAGVSVGFAGAVAALVAAVAAEANLEEAPLVLTGGAATFLGQDGLFGSRPVVPDEHVVGRGLRAALAESLERSATEHGA